MLIDISKTRRVNVDWIKSIELRAPNHDPNEIPFGETSEKWRIIIDFGSREPSETIEFNTEEKAHAEYNHITEMASFKNIYMRQG